MIARFALYGFLKNQRYFEAFLVLALLDRGLDFFRIGLLVAARELTVAVLEIPSGAIADVWGRRRSMILSFVAYIVSFPVLGAAHDFRLLVAAMVFYGVGDAFRTGTHKAMIFAWLRAEGRIDERVRVYGYTRSWSKFGSAASVLVAAVVVLVSDSYQWIFFLAVIPYVVGVVNFLGYPGTLDGETGPEGASIGAVFRHMVRALALTVRRRGLRRLVLEAMGFDGVFTATKDYLQPVLETVAVALAASWALGTGWSDVQRTALLIGPVYFVLHLASGVASRRAHAVAVAAGGEDAAARVLWLASAALYAGLTAAGWFDVAAAMIAVFVLLHVLHNLWRPVLISRFDVHGTEREGASLLSIEGQARRLATMLVAPPLGAAVDLVMVRGTGGAYWPVGALGLAVGVLLLLTCGTRGDVRHRHQ